MINLHRRGIILQKLAPSPPRFPVHFLNLQTSLPDLQACRTHRLITKSSQLHRTAAQGHANVSGYSTRRETIWNIMSSRLLPGEGRGMVGESMTNCMWGRLKPGAERELRALYSPWLWPFHFNKHRMNCSSNFLTCSWRSFDSCAWLLVWVLDHLFLFYICGVEGRSILPKTCANCGHNCLSSPTGLSFRNHFY